MIAKLKELFFGKPEEPVAVLPKPTVEGPKKPAVVTEKKMYDFRTVTVADLDNYPDALMDMTVRKYDGFLVKNVISTEEAQTILSNMKRIPTEFAAETKEAFTYPKIFAQYSLENNTPESEVIYYNECAKIANTIGEMLGVDVVNRIEGIFQKIANGRKVSKVPGKNNVGEYPFGTVREFKPPYGKISIHCGNYFQTAFPSFYTDLASKVEVMNQLSYFIMVQPTDNGGDLTLFDLIWDDDQTKGHPNEDVGVFSKKDGRLLFDITEKYDAQPIRPQMGDMIIFEGGSIWHKVEPVVGTKSRVTIGGFMGFSHDGQTFYYWS